MAGSCCEFGTRWVLSPGRRAAAGHALERPRRPLRAAEEDARLDLDRMSPSRELRRAELDMWPRIDVEITMDVAAAHQGRGFARCVLTSVGRHHLEQEEDPPVLAEIRVGRMDDGVVEKRDLAGIEREIDRFRAVERGIDILLARQETAGFEGFLVRQQRPPMRARTARMQPCSGRDGDSASATMTTIGLTSA